MALDKSNNPFTNFRIGFHTGVPGENPLNEGLVAYYTLDETSGVRFDCGPNNIDLSIFNTVGFNPDGIIDGAASFTGIGRLTSGTNTALDDLVGEDFSYCGWFTLNNNTFSQTFVAIGDGNIGVGNENLSYLFFDGGSQSIVIAIPQGTSYSFLGWNINGGTPINSFLFLAVKYNAATKTISLRINDGGFPANLTLTNQLAVASSPKVSFGALTNNGIPQDGLADETVIYNRILSDAEFDFYYRGGGILPSVVCAYYFESGNMGHDESKNGIDLTLHDGVSPKNGIIGGAIGFNGREEGASSEPQSALDNLRENSFSITMWGRVDSVATESGVFLGLLSGIGTGDILITILYFDPAQGIVASIYHNGGTNSDIIFLYQTTIPKTHHFP